jgi:hypothetical protein
MPIPLDERKISKLHAAKRWTGRSRHLIQINAEMDADRAQLVVVGPAFKNFSQGT